MTELAGELEARLGRIESAIDALRTRLDAIEAGDAAPGRTLERPLPAAASRASVVVEAEPSVDDPELKHPMALMGRSVLILGGAFVLRALTESQVLPALAGVAAGLAYAFLWMFLADRAARRGHAGEAIFDCATAALIAYPMIWETTARFKLVSPAFGCAAVLAVSVMLLWVGGRDGLRSIAWMATWGGSAVFIALAAGTGTLLAPMLSATLFAAAALTVTARRAWSYVSWPAIATSDLLALAMLGMTMFRKGSVAPPSLIAGLLLFAGIWFSAIVVRAIAWRSEPTLVEIAQLVEVALVGIGGSTAAAMLLLGSSAAGPAWFAVVFGALLVAASVYAASRSLPELTAACSGVGGLMFLVGSLLLAGRGPASLLWAALAVAAAAAARKSPSLLATIHAAGWIAAAALASAMPLYVVKAFAGTGALITWPVATAALGAAAVYVTLRGVAGTRGARVIALAIVAIQVLALAMALALANLPALGPSQLAVSGTAVLAIIAAALASTVKTHWIPEAGIIARVLLACGGVKLLLQDIRVLNAAPLVISLAIYGGAMLLVARAGSASADAGAEPVHPVAAP